jgi:hypothetical protein
MQDQRSAKITLDKDFQKKRGVENYHKDVEREWMEKEIERQRVEKLERLQRENEEMKNWRNNSSNYRLLLLLYK